MKNRLRIKITGESGQGINVTGDLLAKALKSYGYFVLGYREYPSLIKGGYANYQIEISDEPLYASSWGCDIMVCLSRVSLHKYFETLESGSVLLHTLNNLEFTTDELKQIERKKIAVHYINATDILKKLNAPLIAQNVLMASLVWQMLDLPLQPLQSCLELLFKDKEKALQTNTLIVRTGIDYTEQVLPKVHLLFKVSLGVKDYMYVSGNEVIGLGALASGVKAVYGYPMTPASSLISFLGNTAPETGIIFKQAEDEITAVQMTLGSMFVGTRALTATSGGGFDLMTESLSLAGITETPLVIVLAQRPGPATGMPTWTAAADLNLALYAGHGEFPRCVIALQNASSAFELVGNAFNIAEEYQIPVILLTDKYIAETNFTINPSFVTPIISNGLLNSEQMQNENNLVRYKFTKTGVSPRWLPGASDVTYTANSDEHNQVGAIVEDAEPAMQMQQKRMSKLNHLLTNLPEPVLSGNPRAKFVVITWGSTYSAVDEALNSMTKDEADNFQHLNFTYIWPLRTSLLQGLISDGKKFIVVEQNQTAQLEGLLRQHVKLSPFNTLLKFDGRPFWVQEVTKFLKSCL